MSKADATRPESTTPHGARAGQHEARRSASTPTGVREVVGGIPAGAVLPGRRVAGPARVRVLGRAAELAQLGVDLGPQAAAACRRTAGGRGRVGSLLLDLEVDLLAE